MKHLSKVAGKVAQLMSNVIHDKKLTVANAIAGLEPQTDEVIAVDRKVLQFLLTKYSMSLGGFETPTYRRERIAREVGELESHDEIQTYVELESMSGPVQQFLKTNE